jgi:predicted 2-oxoglutarate/Fe(II)-dependent dioxygenase YbiX
VRIASFFWLQGMIRDACSMLFDLDQTIHEPSAERGMEDAERHLPRPDRLLGGGLG